MIEYFDTIDSESGVSAVPGLIEDSTDLKILLLFAMRKLGMPATIEEIADLTVGLPGTNITYFDVAAALGALADTEHLTLELAKYELTEKGVRNGEVTESDVPYSLRRHTESRALELRSKLQRLQLVRTSRTIMRSGGYEVEMKLSDGESEVLLLRVLAVNEQQAKQLEENFRERAERVFTVIMDELIG